MAIIPYSQTEEGLDRLDPKKTRGHSLGVVRRESVSSNYDITILLAAARSLPSITLFNPNDSIGCSPVLRAFMVQTGLAHSIVNEVAEDGQVFGHEGGNAIDVGGGNVAALQVDIRTIIPILRLFALLFATVVYEDPDDDGFSLYIWDGAVTTKSAIQSHLGLGFPGECQNKIHVSSSFGRLYSVMHGNSTVKALFANVILGTTYQQGEDRFVYTIDPTFSKAAYQTGQKENTRW